MMKTGTGLTTAGATPLAALLYLVSAASVLADTTDLVVPAELDTSRWECEYCIVESGFSGEAELGVGDVSDDSFKFGEYNGLEDDGAFLIGNGTARYRDGNAGYLDLKVRDLGLDTRSLDLEGGRQGRYRLFLTYDEIPHNISDSARTPYLGSGGDMLGLPANWVTAGSTAGMTELAGSLRNADLDTQRQRFGIGGAFIPARKWETSVSFRHEVRDGQLGSGGAFFFNAAQLVEPIDYVTDELEAAVTYTTRKWQARLSYYGSFFDNDDESLTWQNAFNPVVAGADAGQLAMPPDNQFHQVLLASGYQLSDRTRVSGDIAMGRMEQDENLLEATINPNLAVALPRTSADAEVETLTANLKADSAITGKLRLNAAYRYNDRDNTTPSELFEWVTTDSFVNPPRRNLPYSFTDNTGSLGADYRFSGRTRLSVGYDYQKRERTNQEVRDTTENTVWARFRMRAGDYVDLELGAGHADRDASNYDPVAETDPSQNPLLRKYNMADRTRDTGSIHAGVSPHERVSISLDIDYSKDDYSDSLVGLTESRDTRYNADVSVILTDVTTLTAFGGREQIKSEQAGSQAFAAPDWFAKNDDTFDSFGIGVKHQLIEDKLDVGADYVWSRSTGEIRVDNGSSPADFPDLKTSLDTLNLYASYRLRDNLTLRAAYWYEEYDSSDWMLDGVNPATIPNVIAFGDLSPEYDVHVITMSVRYQF
jgi:MtrB/PioB family decaheme-associated outer membrane protein